MSAALARGFDDLLLLAQRFHPAQADFLTGRQVIAHEILKYDADSLSEVQRVQFSYVDAVDKYPALGWIVKAAQEFDQSRFAGTVGAYQRDLFTRSDAQIDITQSPFLAFRIAKADAAKFDTLAQGNWQFPGMRGNLHLSFQSQKIEKIGHKQIVLVNATDARQNTLKSSLALTKDSQIKCHISEGNSAVHSLPDDPRIGAVKSQSGDKTQAEPRDRTPQRQRFVFPKEFFEKRHVTRKQCVAEIEEFDFLGRGIFGKQSREVVDLPGFRRPVGKESKTLFREAGLGNKRGNACD